MVQQRLSANGNLSILPIVLQYSHRDASEGGLSAIIQTTEILTLSLEFTVTPYMEFKPFYYEY